VDAVNNYKKMLLTYGPDNRRFAASVNQAGGIFGSNGAGLPKDDRGFLEDLSKGIDTDLYGIGG
jgi:hypothetical protein